VFFFSVILFAAISAPIRGFHELLIFDASSKLARIIGFINDNTPNHKACFLSVADYIPYRFIDRLKVKSVSRFPGQILLPGLIKRLAAARTTKEKNKIIKYKQEIINMTVKDLQLDKPDLLVIYDPEKPILFNQRFDYIKFFSQDKRFVRIINSYRYVNQIGDLIFYRRKEMV
jgi:hypothetical protein